MMITVYNLFFYYFFFFFNDTATTEIYTRQDTLSLHDALPISVVLLGDGEFDGTRLQQTLQQAGWSYACRTATSTVATWEGEAFRLDALGACLKPGMLIECKEVYVTREAYGPIMVLCCWAKGYQEPLSLVSNMATAEEACRL